MGQTPDTPSPLNTQQLGSQQRKENNRVFNQALSANRLNQTDQFGNTLNFQQTGTDGQGNPQYAVNQSLGAGGQQFLDNATGLSNQYFQQAGNTLNNPLNLNTEISDYIHELGTARLDPRMERDQAALENKLANQGISVGSEAYSNAMGDFGQAKNDAYNQLALNAQNTAANQALSQYNTNLGALSQLGGQAANFVGQTVNPNYQNYAQVQPQGVNYMGLAQMGQQDAWNQYNAQQQANQNMWGGVGSLLGTGAKLAMAPTTGGGSLIGGFFS